MSFYVTKVKIPSFIQFLNYGFIWSRDRNFEREITGQVERWNRSYKALVIRRISHLSFFNFLSVFMHYMSQSSLLPRLKSWKVLFAVNVFLWCTGQCCWPKDLSTNSEQKPDTQKINNSFYLKNWFFFSPWYNPGPILSVFAL